VATDDKMNDDRPILSSKKVPYDKYNRNGLTLNIQMKLSLSLTKYHAMKKYRLLN